MTTNNGKILLLPGDGIGPEVIKEAIKKPQLHHKKRMEASDKFLGKIDYCCSKRILDAISDSGIIIGA